MKQFLRPLVTDRQSNPEIIRSITFIGALACLLVFVESSVHYAIHAGKDYDPEKVGSLMDHFSTAFAWIIAAGAGGIAARNITDKKPLNADQPEEDKQ